MEKRAVLLAFATVLLAQGAFAAGCNYSLNKDSECAGFPSTPYCVDYSCQYVANPSIYCSDPDNNDIYVSTAVSGRYRDYSGRFVQVSNIDECLYSNAFVPSCTGAGCKVREVTCKAGESGEQDFIEYSCPLGCGNGACAATCSDGIKNGSETDIDCGGGGCPTGSCANGKACAVNADCVSGNCSSGICAEASLPASCYDRIMNGGETGIDCGGTCYANCENGEGCLSSMDCQSNYCENNLCGPMPNCFDGKKNGNETDIDCGGGDCAPYPCANGKACIMDYDCISLHCAAGICVSGAMEAGCSDGVKNGSETDIDCGGGGCPTGSCANGKACAVNADCASRNCDGNMCVADETEEGEITRETEIPEQVDNSILLHYIDLWAKTVGGTAADETVSEERMLEVIEIWKRGLRGNMGRQ